MNRLYVWRRTDVESMGTTGKGDAQVAHAASQAAQHFSDITVAGSAEYRDWENDARSERNPNSRFPLHAFAGFGTTIVLDGGTDDDLEELYYHQLSDFHDRAGMVVDPSFPVRDGRKTFFVEALTCVWVFGNPDTDQDLNKIVRKYSLA